MILYVCDVFNRYTHVLWCSHHFGSFGNSQKVSLLFSTCSGPCKASWHRTSLRMRSQHMPWRSTADERRSERIENSHHNEHKLSVPTGKPSCSRTSWTSEPKSGQDMTSMCLHSLSILASFTVGCRKIAGTSCRNVIHLNSTSYKLV